MSVGIVGRTRLVSIRFKSVIATIVLMGLLWGTLLVAIWQYGRMRIGELEAAEVSRSLDRVTAILDHEARALSSTAADWGTWDDAYRFVQGQNANAFTSENLTPDTVADLDVDFMVYCDSDGTVVGSSVSQRLAGDNSSISTDEPRFEGIANSSALTATQAQGASAGGMISTPEGVTIVAAVPVTDSSGTAPQQGTFLVGRLIDESRLPELRALSTIQIDLFGMSDEQLPGDVAEVSAHSVSSPNHAIAASGDLIKGYRVLNDIDGNPAITLRTTQPRDLAKAATVVLTNLVTVLAVFSIGLVAMVALLNEQLVLGRLARIRAELLSLGISHDPTARLRVTGNDEISEVARGVNRMLDDLEGSSSELAFMANHDSLTRLLNRRRFEAELESRLEGDERGAVLWLDLDHFKEINDSLGHAAGDELLRELASVFLRNTRGTNLVARLGGDEFGILLPDADAAQGVTAARRLLRWLGDHAFFVGEHEVRISASIGVVTYPEHGSTCDDLLVRADLAMYHSKRQGRNHVSLYSADDSWRSEMSDRIAASERIVKSIRAGRMRFFGQPITNIQTGKLLGYELLLRVSDRDGTTLPTMEVVQTAERLGLIRDIDRWAIRNAVRLLAMEQKAGRDTILHVNLSGSAFSDQGVLDVLRTQLQRSGVAPERLVVEITETSAITDMAFARGFIDELRRMGCRFALDDFGAGASSLYYLKHLPVDILKIDGSLIKNLGADTPDIHLVDAIVDMCRALNIVTVAEFVENEMLYALTSEHGIECAQGYAIGLPAPIEDYLGRAMPAEQPMLFLEAEPLAEM